MANILLVRPLDTVMAFGTDYQACNQGTPASPQCNCRPDQDPPCHPLPFVSNLVACCDLDTTPPVSFTRLSICSCCNGESSTNFTASRCSQPPNLSDILSVHGHTWLRNIIRGGCIGDGPLPRYTGGLYACCGIYGIVNDLTDFQPYLVSNIGGDWTKLYTPGIGFGYSSWAELFWNFDFVEGHAATNSNCDLVNSQDIFDIYLEVEYSVLPPPPYPPGINPPIAPVRGRTAIIEYCCCGEC